MSAVKLTKSVRLPPPKTPFPRPTTDLGGDVDPNGDGLDN